MAGLAEHRTLTDRHTLRAAGSSGWPSGARSCTSPPSSSSTSRPPASTRSAAGSFWDLIYQLAGEGVTVFVTTHYMDEAEYCDRLGLIYRGELIALGTPGELKTRFMTEAVIEVLCERPHEAVDFIEEIVGVKHAALFGKGLHVVTDSADRTITAIREVLATHRIEVTRTERIVPSLEDVFVSLIEAKDRVEAPQREFAR